jgi:hypothetical protein
MKAQLLEVAYGHMTTLRALQKKVRSYRRQQVQDGNLLSEAKAAASEWFDVVKPAFEGASFSADAIGDASARFEQLLRMSKTRPRRQTLLSVIDAGLSPYADIIHQIEIGTFAPKSALNIGPFIEGLPSDEGEYMAEAQRCLTVDALRGCVVLGWCATIARIHAKIAEIGYDKFSTATAEMMAKSHRPL